MMNDLSKNNSPNQPLQSEITKLQLEITRLQSQLLKTNLDAQSAEKNRDEVYIELRKIKREYKLAKASFEDDLSTYPPLIAEMEQQDKQTKAKIDDSINDLAKLEKILHDNQTSLDETRKTSIEINNEINNNRDKLQDLITKQNIAADQVATNQHHIKATKDEIDKFTKESIKVKGLLDDLRADYEVKKKRVEEDMKVTVQRSIDVTERLRQLQDHEQKLNDDILRRIKELDNREDSINKAESKFLSKDKSDFLQL